MTAAELNDYATLTMTVGALLAGFWVWRGKVLQRIQEWGRSVKARKRATEAMVTLFPAFMEDSSLREDKSAAREVRLTAEFAGLRQHLEQQDLKLDSIIAHQWGAMKLDLQARFICDSEGRNIEVNTAYASLLRVGEASLKGYGYKNYVDPSQLQSYLADVMQAFKDHRRFEGSVVLVRGDGTRFLGHVRLEPYPEDPLHGAATHWFGALTMVEEMGR